MKVFQKQEVNNHLWLHSLVILYKGRRKKKWHLEGSWIKAEKNNKLNKRKFIVIYKQRLNYYKGKF